MPQSYAEEPKLSPRPGFRAPTVHEALCPVLSAGVGVKALVLRVVSLYEHMRTRLCPALHACLREHGLPLPSNGSAGRSPRGTWASSCSVAGSRGVSRGRSPSLVPGFSPNMCVLILPLPVPACVIPPCSPRRHTDAAGGQVRAPCHNGQPRKSTPSMRFVRRPRRGTVL